MMVIFLVGIVSMILMRTLRKDYARYNEKDIDQLVRICFKFALNCLFKIGDIFNLGTRTWR